MMVWKVVIERVTVIKFRVDNGGGNGAGCFEVEIWADTAKFTNVIVAGFRKCQCRSYLCTSPRCTPPPQVAITPSSDKKKSRCN